MKRQALLVFTQTLLSFALRCTYIDLARHILFTRTARHLERSGQVLHAYMFAILLNSLSQLHQILSVHAWYKHNALQYWIHVRASHMLDAGYILACISASPILSTPVLPIAVSLIMIIM